MRYCTFEAPDGPRPGILQASSILLDVRAIDPGLEGSLIRLAADPELSLRFLATGHVEPPVGTVLRADTVRFLAPVDPGRLCLVGASPAEVAPSRVVGPGEDLPAGSWRAGVGAVVRHRVREVGDDWTKHLIGFVPFHLVGDAVCVGPWIVGNQEILEPHDVGFAAFANDEPRFKQLKADMDWDEALTAAHAKRTLRAGDIVGIASPAEPVEGDLRCALICRGTVLARLEATATAAPGAKASPAAATPDAVAGGPRAETS